MYVLMRKFPCGGNQHNVDYSNRPEGATFDIDVAKSWCKIIEHGWGGEQYYVEVPVYEIDK